jgi:predicted nuclease with TOPRIM domain
VTCPTERLEYCPKDGYICSKKYLEERVAALEAERDRLKHRENELSEGWKRLHSENEDLRSRLAEALGVRNRVGKTFNIEYELLENGNDCIYTRQQIIGMLSTILGNQFSETMVTLRGEAEG